MRVLKFSLLSLMLWFLAVEQALACAVCVFSDGESQRTFLFTTAFLTLAPLTMIGGILYYLKKKYRSPALKDGEEAT